MSEGEEKKGWGGCIVWLIIAAVAVFGFLKFGQQLREQQTTGLAVELKTPGEAVKAFAKRVNKVKALSSNDLGIDELLNVVTKDDKKWYFDNQSKIYKATRGGFNELIGYQSTSTVEESVGAMMSLLEYCPSREDAIVEKEEIHGNTALVVVNQPTRFGSRTYEVKLKKEGRLWKVDGFCGGRKAIEAQIASEG
jgi:hypothetical protein